MTYANWVFCRVSSISISHRREAAGGPANLARLTPEEAEIGIPVARYPEWDYLISRDRGE